MDGSQAVGQQFLAAEKVMQVPGGEMPAIRSMATRGSFGGIAFATAEVVQVLDAAGYDMILIETVGAGQSEVEIAHLAHTTVVVEAPGLGDDIQAIKAGILEIADVLVVNKADLPGVENTERALRGSLDLAHPLPQYLRHHGTQDIAPGWEDKTELPELLWEPPILRTVAIDGTGIPGLADAITAHRLHLDASGGWVLRDRWRPALFFSGLFSVTSVSLR